MIPLSANKMSTIRFDVRPTGDTEAPETTPIGRDLGAAMLAATFGLSRASLCRLFAPVGGSRPPAANPSIATSLRTRRHATEVLRVGDADGGLV